MRLLFLALTLVSCITPYQKKKMNRDLFVLQKRLLDLENRLNTEQAVIQGQSTQNIAAAQVSIQKIQDQFQKFAGQLQELQIGVETGQMPGNATEGSIRSKLEDISQKIEVLQANQSKLLKVYGKKAVDVKPKNTRLANLSQAHRLFKKKKYKRIIKDGPNLIKRLNGSDKSEMQYLYGESLYKLGRMRDAALTYNDILQNPAGFKNLAFIHMRLGDCFRRLGDRDASEAYYHDLLNKFPDSKEAKRVKSRIAKASTQKPQGA